MIDSLQPIARAQAIGRYLSRAGALDFPIGGEVTIPQPDEVELLEALEGTDLSRDELGDLRRRLDIQGAYTLVVFSLRMAVWAVRAGRRSTLIAGLIGMALGGRLVDWRDLLGALSIIEECSKRLGLNFQAVLDELRKTSEPTLIDQVEESYCSRSAGMRSVATMGIEVVGPDEHIVFRPQDPLL